MNFYNESASLDVKLQGKMFINPFFHLFAFLCSLVRSFVHIECVCLRKQTSHAGSVESMSGC